MIVALADHITPFVKNEIIWSRDKIVKSKTNNTIYTNKHHPIIVLRLLLYYEIIV